MKVLDAVANAMSKDAVGVVAIEGEVGSAGVSGVVGVVGEELDARERVEDADNNSALVGVE